jgi:sterol 24-C-methyltransferase
MGLIDGTPSLGDVVSLGIFILVIIQVFTPADPIVASLRLIKHLRSQEKGLTCATKVDAGIDEYTRLHSSCTTEERNQAYKSLVNSYYDLATLFYEWGWGQSFHFASRFSNESFAESIRRHEYYLASKLGITGDGAKTKILDCGCGIGGPMRNISKFTGADITGITLNQYQVDRGNEILKTSFPELKGKCRSVQGDFMNMPFESESFDAAYAIEATCHAPDRVGVYSEIYRVLKPGSIFAVYEWCMTDAFDPSNKDHLRIKKEIEEGDGLPDICHTSVCVEALKKAGFDVLHNQDLADEDIGSGGKPWMTPLLPSWNPFTQRFQFNWLGQILTKYMLIVLEFLRLAPSGTSKTQLMLQKGGIGLGDGGKLKIFTPMYLMVARVPEKKK